MPVQFSPVQLRRSVDILICLPVLCVVQCSEGLNLEGLWRLGEAGLLTMELYVVKYVQHITWLVIGLVRAVDSQSRGYGFGSWSV